MFPIMRLLLLLIVVGLEVLPAAVPQPKFRILIIDGRNNHAWRETTPVLKRELEDAGIFSVSVATAPASNAGMKHFHPAFSKYAAVILNYTDFGNGGKWPAATRQSFVRYVAGGGGVVAIHAALSAFPKWPEFNEIIGLGGWGDRNQSAGPYVYVAKGRTVLDHSRGLAGHHGEQHPYLVVIRDPAHPITVGMPRRWMHVKDELYDHLRGPARNLTILATAYSDPATGGSGHDEPVLYTVRYGRGRIFCMTFGHDGASMRGSGFASFLQRGSEWAASGRVTLRLPHDFPSAVRSSVRP